MMHIPAREIVDAMAAPGREGPIAMLRSYFDDSGTHAGSPVVLWGGVIGPPAHFEKLEGSWSKLLNDPCEGHKPPVTQFHLFDCAYGLGEFAGYSQGEKDLTRRLFRQAMIEAGLISVSYGIETAPYDRLIKGHARTAFGEPNARAFYACAMRVIQLAQRGDRVATVVFDKGQMTSEFAIGLRQVEKLASRQGCKIQYSFAGVQETVGLQAADIVATESFWKNKRIIGGNDDQVPPHFKALIDKMPLDGAILREHGIKKMVAAYRVRRALGRA